jgi:hypothetical protein
MRIVTCGARAGRAHQRVGASRDRIVIGSVVVVAIGLLVGLAIALGAGPAPAGSVPDGATPLAEVADDLPAADGRVVAATGVEVEGVPADEGFWVDAGGERVWVQVSTAGESPFAVTDDDSVTFTGRVVRHEADFAQRPEFSAADAEALAEVGAHVEVDVGDLRLGRG